MGFSHKLSPSTYSKDIKKIVLGNHTRYPNVMREVIRYEYFVVIIPVLIKYLNLEKKI